MDQDAISWKFSILKEEMDERLQRLWAASEAKALKWGGISRVAKATGLSRTTITAGQREIETLPNGKEGAHRIRRPGGGRKPLSVTHSGLKEALDALVEPTTRGDPMSPLRWTCLSVRKLAAELEKQGWKVSPQKVADLLHEMGYSLQSNRKVIEGASHPDRNAQFDHINRSVKDFQKRGQPVISVDTKKKELVGNFRNEGQEWQLKGKPVEVEDHDFLKEELGKVIP
jgi:transposase